MPRTVPTIALASAVSLASLVSAGAAQASAPDIFERHADRSGVLASCTGYDVTLTASIDSRYVVSLDEDGQPVREIRHVTFTGTLSGPGGQLPYTGHFTRTADFLDERAVFTGLRFAVPIEGGPRLIAAGTDAFSLDPDDDFSRATGRVPDEFYADVCAALAPSPRSLSTVRGRPARAYVRKAGRVRRSQPCRRRTG